MDNKIKLIHDWIDAHQDEIIEDFMTLLRFPSVSDFDAEVKPFGQPCIDALNHMLKEGEKLGFAPYNYENYVGELKMDPSKSAEESIGVWAHLDVVPVGDGWNSDPFDPFIKDGCIVARGATDNKDAAIGTLYIMRAIKELGINLKHNISLYLGTNEEKGMFDIQYYLDQNYPIPKFSLIPDAGWPGILGEFGRIEYDLVSDEKVSEDILDIHAGHATNIIPGEAYIVLSKKMGFDLSKVPEGYAVEETDDTVKITAFGKNGHAAFPDDGAVNALYYLTKVVAENGCLNEYDQKIFDFLTAINADYYGSTLGVTGEDEYGSTINSATMADVIDGKLYIRNDCRTCISADQKALAESITKSAAANGMTPNFINFIGSAIMDPNSPEVKVIESSYQEAMNSDAKLEITRGFTYAGKVPNSIATGIANNIQSKLPPREPGHGGPHQPDEMRLIEVLFSGMKLFATILLKLDDVIE